MHVHPLYLGILTSDALQILPNVYYANELFI